VKKGGVDFEATTPTGAAILATLGQTLTPIWLLNIEKTAYGVGQKDTGCSQSSESVSLGETL